MMTGMIRKMARNISRAFSGQRTSMAGIARQTGGLTRAGMHRKAEYEYQQAALASDAAPVPETVEDALDMPDSLEAEIPSEEETTAEGIRGEIAEGTAEVAPDEEILEEVSEAQTEEPETETVTLAVDYSGERIPEILPPAATGSVGAETELTYSPGDNGLKEIREPLPGLGERSGVPVKVSSTDTVISVPETEIEFGIDGNGHLIVSE